VVVGARSDGAPALRLDLDCQTPLFIENGNRRQIWHGIALIYGDKVSAAALRAATTRRRLGRSGDCLAIRPGKALDLALRGAIPEQRLRTSCATRLIAILSLALLVCDR
jgi:hypothetical protein